MPAVDTPRHAGLSWSRLALMQAISLSSSGKAALHRLAASGSQATCSLGMSDRVIVLRGIARADGQSQNDGGHDGKGSLQLYGRTGHCPTGCICVEGLSRCEKQPSL